MTNKEALEILTKTDRVGVNFIFANDEETTKYNQDSEEALTLAIKALDLLIRLEGFKYVTTSVMLKENELAHFDVYKTGWNDAIEAVKVASNRPLSEIINSIKETEAMEGYND